MQKLLFSLLLFLTFQSYAQQANLTQKVFSCDFAEGDKIYWPVKNNSGFNFIIANGVYTIECLDDEKKAYAPLKWENVLENFKMETNVRLEKGESGTFGLAFGVQGKLENAYILQFDRRGRFRVVEIGPAGEVPLTGDKKNEGWLENKKLNKPGKYNRLGIEQQDGTIKVFLNYEPAFSLHNKFPILNGGFGFFLEGRCGAVVDDFKIYGPGEAKPDSIAIKATRAQKQQKIQDSATKQVQKEESKTVKPPAIKSPVKEAAKKPAPDKKIAIEPKAKKTKASPDVPVIPVVKDSPTVKAPSTVQPKVAKPAKTPVTAPLNGGADTSKDIATLGVALGECRRNSQKLKTDNENTAAELKQIRIKNEELQAFINKYLDIKLKADYEQVKAKMEIVQKENDALKDENTNLKTLKENIAAAKDGDIIILLSDKLRKEQKEAEGLAKKLKELEDKMKAYPVPASKPLVPPVKPRAKQTPAGTTNTDSAAAKPASPAKHPHKPKAPQPVK
jgi:hypothetical protein